MSTPSTLSLEELTLVINRVVDGLRQSGVTEIELKNDYFWAVPDDQIYQVESAPHDLTIGQVTESWQWLLDLLKKNDQPIDYSLVWLSDVFKAIGLQRSR